MRQASALSMILLVLVVLVALAGGAWSNDAGAQDSGNDEDYKGVAGDSKVPERTLVDFRRMLMIGFSMVFVLIIGYLVMSHRKNAALVEDLQFLRERMESLDGRRDA